MRQVIVLFFAVALVRSGCLPDATLKSLGFESSQNAGTIGTPTICTDIFKTKGTCVPEGQVKAKLEADNADLKDAISGISIIFEAVAEAQKTVAELAKMPAEDVAKIKAAMDAQKNGCVNAYSTLQQGVTCFLASNDANTYTQASTETALNININAETAGAALSSCMPILSLTCEFTAGVTIDASASSHGDEEFTMTNETAYKSACEAIRSTAACTTAACFRPAYQHFIATFFKPYDYTMFPTKAVAKKIAKVYKNTTKEMKKAMKDSNMSVTPANGNANGNANGGANTPNANGNANGNANTPNANPAAAAAARKLAEIVAINTVPSDNGTDVQAYGTNSGVSKVEADSTYLVSAMVALIVALLAM